MLSDLHNSNDNVNIRVWQSIFVVMFIAPGSVARHGIFRLVNCAVA
jgi:hypothetical protein